MDQEKPLAYSVSEAATIMRVSTNTVYRLVAKGEIPSVRIGGRVFIPRAKLEKIYE